MEIKISGTVEQIQDTQTFASGFTKRVLVIKTSDKYPQTIPIEFAKEKCALLDSLMINQQVTAFINLRGNEWNGKYFASIQGWKLDIGEQSEPTGSPPTPTPNQEPRNMSIPSNRQESQDNIPF